MKRLYTIIICTLQNKPRTAAISNEVSIRKITRKIRVSRDKERETNKTLNSIPDCTIYFPLKGLLGDVDTKVRRRPKFIIIPKDEYVKSHPEYYNNRKNSLQNTLTTKGNRRVTLNYNTEIYSQAECSSPVSLPKKTLFEKRSQRTRDKKMYHGRIKEFRQELRKKKNAQKMRESLNSKTKDKRRHIFDPLIKRKAKHAR